MLKQILFILSMTTSLFSFQVDMWQERNNAVLNFNIYYDNAGGDQGTNWIAIFKQGDSNDWGNVIKWAWAKDLAHNENNYDERLFPLVTEKGSYEVRFFLNNSYDTFATYIYNVGDNNNVYMGIANVDSNTIIFNSTMADKAWIGIYNKGDSNDWGNVQAWSWVTDASTTLDITNLAGADYEARLFYNNSYDVETTVNFTKEGGGNDKGHIAIETQTTSQITLNSTDADQAWIGIYSKGEANDWNNVQAWGWVDSPTTIDISNLAAGTYEARLFYNNSYDVETTLEFTKDGNENRKKVLVSKSTDKNNNGDIDYVTNYTYHANGKLKTTNSGQHTTHYNDHGDVLRYQSDAPDWYRYFYNNIGKVEKRETLNADGTVKSSLRYEYNDHGDETNVYSENKIKWYSTYEYNANGNILKKESSENNAPYKDEFIALEIFKYDDQNRVIEYNNITDDSQDFHYSKSYNNNGKEVERIDLSHDDDGVSHDRYYEYDDEGYLIVEKVDAHDSPDHLKKGNIDTIIYYKWQ